ALLSLEQSSQSSGKGGKPGQVPPKRQPATDYQQYAAAPYPGHEVPLPYETPLHAQMEVDQEEEHHKCQFQEVRHKRYYQLGPSRHQASAPTYACTVAPVVRREVAPLPGTSYELKWLYNPHVPCRDCIIAYMLLSELKDFTQHCNMALHNRTMTLLCSNPAYWDLVNPMQGPEDLPFAEKHHIPLRFLHAKDDRSTALRMTRTPDPNVPFNLDQLV
ncbi:hypothetical protein C0992_008066, partial [Termitomyces sp. T32_za158]